MYGSAVATLNLSNVVDKQHARLLQHVADAWDLRQTIQIPHAVWPDAIVRGGQGVIDDSETAVHRILDEALRDRLIVRRRITWRQSTSATSAMPRWPRLTGAGRICSTGPLSAARPSRSWRQALPGLSGSWCVLRRLYCRPLRMSHRGLGLLRRREADEIFAGLSARLEGCTASAGTRSPA